MVSGLVACIGVSRHLQSLVFILSSSGGFGLGSKRVEFEALIWWFLVATHCTELSLRSQ